MACARITGAFGFEGEIVGFAYMRFRATGSTRLLPGWLDARVTIKCIHSCFDTIMWEGDQSAEDYEPLTVRRSCSFLGGTAVNCSVDFSFEEYGYFCDAIFEVDMAAATRFGTAALPLPESAYTRLTEFLTPCPTWHKI